MRRGAVARVPRHDILTSNINITTSKIRQVTFDLIGNTVRGIGYRVQGHLKVKFRKPMEKIRKNHVYVFEFGKPKSEVS